MTSKLGGEILHTICCLVSWRRCLIEDVTKTELESANLLTRMHDGPYQYQDALLELQELLCLLEQQSHRNLADTAAWKYEML